MSLLDHSILSTHLSNEKLDEIAALGEEITLPPQSILFERDENSDYLYIVIEGFLAIKKHFLSFILKNYTVIGPGCFVGEIGCLLNTKRMYSIYSLNQEVRLWRFDKNKFQYSELMTDFLLALLPYLHIRHQKIMRPFYKHIARTENHCDYQHIAIKSMAALLKGADPWQTTTRIWNFVMKFPYRLGLWNLKASDTLMFGYGMCTTKANLQIALLRAANIECRLCELSLPPSHITDLLPACYHSVITKEYKHYFVQVKLDDNWYPCEATYPQVIIQYLASLKPKYLPYVNQIFSKEFFESKRMPEEYYDFKVINSIESIMRKRPFYDEDIAEALNVVIDKLQLRNINQPYWYHELCNIRMTDPSQSFYLGLAKAIYLANEIYTRRK